MKLPRGFGKNYFTLNAITATVNQINLNANISRVHKYHIKKLNGEELKQGEEIEELENICLLPPYKKPCHCNYYFLKYTQKMLQLFYKQEFFFNYFKSLNNSISPPIFKP